MALVIPLFWLRWAPGKCRLCVEGSVVLHVDCSGCLGGRARRTWAQHLGGPAPPVPLPSGAATLRSPLPCALSPQCSPWPDVAYQVNSAPSPSYNGSPNSFGLGEGYVTFLPWHFLE